jgi:hypothetical protein
MCVSHEILLLGKMKKKSPSFSANQKLVFLTTVRVVSVYTPPSSNTYRRVGYLPTLSVAIWRIFGPKRDEVTGEWRGLHNEEHNDLYSSPNIVRVIKPRRMRWAGNLACMGERRGVYRILVGRPERRRPLGRPRRRLEDNIKTDIQEVEGGHGLD